MKLSTPPWAITINSSKLIFYLKAFHKMDNRQLLEIFQSRNLIDSSLADEILAEIDNSGKSVPELLADFQIVDSKDDVWPVVASELGASLVDLRNWTPPDALLALLPAGTARLHGAFPVNFDEQGLHVALVDPLNPQTVEDLRFALGREIIVVIAPDYLVEAKINECYGGEGRAMDDILGQLDSNADAFDPANAEAEANSAPIIRYVDLVLYQAIKEKASDIHFEPFEKDFKIRYRVDGALYEMAPPPVHLALPILSRVKVMANMNIAERRLPQDGRIVKQFGDKQVDMRVSTLPTQHGESVVLRVLDRSSVNLSLENLGLPPAIYEYIGDTIEKPNGIFIVTGPTGAGKTTTLYAGLRRINTIDAKLLTAEDPVEYDIDGIIQIPINEAIGLDFPRILRAFLRQDPDRIMIGEMRDKETATIAIQAALTGHLVLSTLHTNDSAGAVTRLIDMGCEPFLVAASLEGILAQRLVRTICKECKASYEPTETILSQLGVSPHELGDKQFFTGSGCEVCGQTGYRGRAGLYELLNITEPIRELITARAPTVVIKQKAIELGMNTLREDGLRNIYLGKTTIEEVLKYT
jgi:type IV pilus assembly protein PilB